VVFDFDRLSGKVFVVVVISPTLMCPVIKAPTGPPNGYTAEDGTTYYVAEDGTTYYVQES
jgi:hypothetical protein